MFILTQVFSLVYLGLGIAALFLKDFIPGLPAWGQILFGVACVLYAGFRFYRSYGIWKEANE
jgi:hypothetical protein